MKITELIISPESLGSRFWLTDITPVHVYADNRRTDAVSGFKYTVCLPDKNYEKIGIKVDGKKLLEKPDNGHIDVSFIGLSVFIYWYNGQPQVGAKADGVQAVNSKA